jgi:hypothetical protein
MRTADGVNMPKKPDVVVVGGAGVISVSRILI